MMRLTGSLQTLAGALAVVGGGYLAVSGLIALSTPGAAAPVAPAPASLVLFGLLLLVAGFDWLVRGDR